MSGASSYGKGDKSRISNYKGYRDNYDNIKKVMKCKTYNFRGNTLIIQGDTHSESVVYEIISTRIPNGSDYLHIGDVSLGFGNLDYAINNAKAWIDKINKLCAKLDVRCYLTRGNHDNPDVWKFDNESHVFFLQSGDVGVFPNGKRALLVGGGISVDRIVRTAGTSYWKNEITPTLDNVEKCDIMFSHDCPAHFNHPTRTLHRSYGWYVDRDPTLLEESEAQRLVMSDIANRSEVKIIFGGHFHNTMSQNIDGVYYRCLDINELFFFDADKNYK